MAIAVRVSFDAGGEAAAPAGFTLDPYRFALRDEATRLALAHSLALAAATTVIAVPVGTAMALGLRRTARRPARWAYGLAVLPIATPQIALGVAMFYAFLELTSLRLDGTTQLLAHVTIAIPFVVLIVQARLRGIGGDVEETAMDLGAPPAAAIRRVVLPLLTPGLVAAAAIAFALSFDNFVLSDQLCIDNPCRTIPMFLFGRRGVVAASPDIYALGMMALAISLGALAVALAMWRATRRLTSRLPG